MLEPDFWTNQDTAQAIVAELKAAKAVADPVQELLTEIEDLVGLFELASEENDEETLGQVEAEAAAIAPRLDRVEMYSLLGGPHDARNCYFSVQAGAGGTESCDWAEMLLRMYLRYFERRGYAVQEMARTDGEEAGIRSISLEVGGPFAYGYLSCELGVHRLVRISPFDANSRRHTSFAAVDVLPILDKIEIEIDWAKDVREDTYRASGAGGQHVNKTSSAIRLTHAPTGLVVQCQNERSQHQNRANARKMMQARLFRLEEQKRNDELDQMYGDKGQIAWGQQIRSYVLQPYQMVKDLRTSHQIGNPQRVLDGDLDEFIESYLRMRVGRRSS
jgi:peptide chain release factor 2